MPVLDLPIEVPDDERNYLAAFGYMITAWNRADNALRQLLAGLCGGDTVHDNFRALILTVEMGSRDLHNALYAYAADILDPPISDCVSTAADWHERLLGYRNFYVHGISSVWGGSIGFDFDFGLIAGTSAKGQLKSTVEHVTHAQILWLTEQCELLRRFVSTMLHHLYWSGPRFDSPQTPLPDKPTLPAKLVRNPSPLRDTLLQAEASRGSRK